MDIFFCPVGVWIRGVPLYNAQDTSLIWTLSSVPLVSGLEEFHCIMLRDVDTILCPNDGRADFPVNNTLSVFSLVDVGAP